MAGIEPSLEASEAARSRGLTVYDADVNEFIEQNSADGNARFDVITFLNVLEHVADPISLLDAAKRLLVRQGIVCIVVPNDFSELQTAARKALNKEPWWIAIPDHINYFNFDSLHAILEDMGFEIIHSQADFPMELFLLMGDDYIGSPEVGRDCHAKRVRFESSIDGELRRKIYQALAQIGIGRTCLVLGRLRSK